MRQLLVSLDWIVEHGLVWNTTSCCLFHGDCQRRRCCAAVQWKESRPIHMFVAQLEEFVLLTMATVYNKTSHNLTGECTNELQ